MKIRNGSNETVVDFHTGRVAEPDAVIEVPDAWADSYENHPIWEPVPDVHVSPKSKAAAVQPTSDTTINEEDSP